LLNSTMPLLNSCIEHADCWTSTPIAEFKYFQQADCWIQPRPLLNSIIFSKAVAEFSNAYCWTQLLSASRLVNSVTPIAEFKKISKLIAEFSNTDCWLLLNATNRLLHSATLTERCYGEGRGRRQQPRQTASPPASPQCHL
jgi:hypothetical protein